jgi:hypothetical protein
MNFDSDRILKLAGIPHSGGNGLLKESRLHEEDEAPADEKKVDQAALKDALKQLATALGMEVTDAKDGDAAGGDESGAGEMSALFGGQTEGVAYGDVRKIIRDELATNWASGQVFGKKSKNRDGVTMGFKGIGFK